MISCLKKNLMRTKRRDDLRNILRNIKLLNIWMMPCLKEEEPPLLKKMTNRKSIKRCIWWKEEEEIGLMITSH